MGGLITEGELNRGFTVFSNTPYEKSAYQYIAVGVIRHLHLNADLSFSLKCTEFSIDFRKKKPVSNFRPNRFLKPGANRKLLIY